MANAALVQDLIATLGIGCLAVLGVLLWLGIRKKRVTPVPPPPNAHSCSSRWGDLHAWVENDDGNARFCLTVPSTARVVTAVVTIRTQEGSSWTLRLAFQKGCWRSTERFPTRSDFVAELAVKSRDDLGLFLADISFAANPGAPGALAPS